MLASLVIRIRRSMRLTQARFAASLSVSEASVANWERARNKPAPDSLKKMAQLAPAFREEIGSALRFYEHHRRPDEDSRYAGGIEPGDLHAALDLILDKASERMVKTVTQFLTSRAEKYLHPPGQREAQAAQICKRSMRRVRSPNNA